MNEFIQQTSCPCGTMFDVCSWTLLNR